MSARKLVQVGDRVKDGGNWYATVREFKEQTRFGVTKEMARLVWDDGSECWYPREDLQLY